MSADPVTLELPGDERFVDVALAAAEALASRAGMARDDIADLREQVRAALVDRMGRGAARVVLRYEVGDGYLGLRVEDAAGVTS